MDKDVANGALVGWRRMKASRATVLRLQIASSAERYAAMQFETVTISLNDRRLRSLARDILRAARARGIDLGDR